MKKETEAKSDRASDEQFRSFGHFDPLEAKRLLTRFEEADVRFQISPESILRPMGAGHRLKRYNSIEIFIQEEDIQKASTILNPE
jgi:hypothetical protein